MPAVLISRIRAALGADDVFSLCVCVCFEYTWHKSLGVCLCVSVCVSECEYVNVYLDIFVYMCVSA